MSTKRPLPEEQEGPKRPRRITKDLAIVIKNVFSYFEASVPKEEKTSVRTLVSQTSDATGLSESSVWSARREDVESFPGAQEVETRERPSVVPDDVCMVIRDVVYTRYLREQNVTLDLILADLRAMDNQGGFVWGRTTLWKTLYRIGFECSEGDSYYSQIREKSSIVRQRLRYIRDAQKMRADGYTFWYQDETWLNKNMVPIKQWRDGLGAKGRNAPAGKGQRFIVSHIGSRAVGLLPGALYCVAVNYNKESDDYHNSMNADVFQQWMDEEVFPRISHVPGRHVVVLDHATYHCTPSDETRPVWKTMRKQEIVDWLLEFGVPAAELPPHTPMVVPELKDLCSKVAPPVEPKIVAMGRDWGIEVLFSPVAHPELNPIEEVWALCKSTVRTRNGVKELQDNPGFNMPALKKHLEHAIGKVTRRKWSKIEDMCIKRECDYLAMADMDGVVADSSDESEDDVFDM